MGERLNKAFSEPNAVTRYVCRRALFGAFERLGMHLTADHFYEVIPNTRQVARNYRDAPRSCAGIDLRHEECQSRVCGMVDAFGAEFDEAVGRHGYRVGHETYFRSLDAIVLYSFVRTMKPRRIVEVGQGASTKVMLGALEMNWKGDGRRTQFTTIDPFERIAVDAGSIDFADCRQLRRPIQDVWHSVCDELEAGDLLFLDSTHCFKFGSDVECELEEAVPRVRNGVTVHFHDIFTPYNYPKEWFTRARRFWNEQYMLEMFLRFNTAFRVVAPVYLLSRHSDELAQRFATGTPLSHHRNWGVSFYLERVSGS